MKHHHKYRWAAVIIVLAIPVVFLILLYSDATDAPKIIRRPAKVRRELEVSVEIEEAKPAKPVKTAKVTPPSEPQVSETEKTPDGALPPVSANYRKYLGFKNYVRKMTELGARFFIIGNSGRKMLEIDFAGKKLIPANLQALKNGGFSPRSRSIADEPALKSYLQTATAEYKINDPEIFMLVPVKFDMHIAETLRKSQLPNSCSALKGYYRTGSDGRIILALNEAVCKDGTKKINISIHL